MQLKKAILYYNLLVFMGLIALWCLDSASSCMAYGLGCVYDPSVMYRVAEGVLIFILYAGQIFIWEAYE